MTATSAPSMERVNALSPAVSLHGVNVTRDGRAVLSDLNLDILPGEFIGVFGPNGAGKTTLFRTLLGLQPFTGEARLFGRAVRRGQPQVGYLPQLRAAPLDLRLSGQDFVASAYRGERWGLPVLGRAGQEVVRSALESVGALKLAERPLGGLSGGERQRLLLAQALLGEPKLLLLDEPLISLDPRYQQAVVDLVARVGRERGLTVLFSAHDFNPLLGSMDRVLYLAGGHARLGREEQVITSEALSRLYGAPIEVIRHGGRVFVVNGSSLEGGDAQHDHSH